MRWRHPVSGVAIRSICGRENRLRLKDIKMKKFFSSAVAIVFRNPKSKFSRSEALMVDTMADMFQQLIDAGIVVAKSIKNSVFVAQPCS